MKSAEEIWHQLSLDVVREVCADPTDAEQLLELLGRDLGQRHMTHVMQLLRHNGVNRCVPRAYELLEHADANVRREALATIASFEKEKAAPVYLRALTDKAFRDKSHVVYLLHKYGDKEAVPAMISRFRKIFPKRPRVYLFNTGESELTQIVAFLWRHKESNPRITKLMEDLKKNWSLLKPEEQTWLRDNVSFFA